MIIGVSGKARSGKGEFARYAQEHFGATIVSFAGALKEEAIVFLQRHEVLFKIENIYGANEFREEKFAITDSMLADTEVPVESLMVKFGF